MKRIDYLDGHRGIAILLVIFFHAFSRWTELVPYTDTYAQFPLFQFGFLGVQLFFLLSGFVILMTLEKCVDFKSFLYRRWLRLFPAMSICSVVIFFSTDFFFERPGGIPSAKDLIPGLTFIEPYILSKLIGSVQSIDDIISLIKSTIKTQQIEPGTWVRGFGYDDSLLIEKRHQTRDDLDRATVDHPIILIHVSGHLATVNAAALANKNVDKDTENPDGGRGKKKGN